MLLQDEAQVRLRLAAYVSDLLRVLEHLWRHGARPRRVLTESGHDEHVAHVRHKFYSTYLVPGTEVLAVKAELFTLVVRPPFDFYI